MCSPEIKVLLFHVHSCCWWCQLYKQLFQIDLFSFTAVALTLLSHGQCNNSAHRYGSKFSNVFLTQWSHRSRSIRGHYGPESSQFQVLVIVSNTDVLFKVPMWIRSLKLPNLQLNFVFKLFRHFENFPLLIEDTTGGRTWQNVAEMEIQTFHWYKLLLSSV